MITGLSRTPFVVSVQGRLSHVDRRDMTDRYVIRLNPWGLRTTRQNLAPIPLCCLEASSFGDAVLSRADWFQWRRASFSR
jgi:hypothetical protein